jgi:hypothetical protein
MDMTGTRIIAGWDRAVSLADEQISHWKATQVSPLMAAAALDIGELDEAHWAVIRRRLAAWLMTHPEKERGGER